MMERVVRQNAGGALRNATPNLSTLALAPSDDKVSTSAALEPLTLRTLARPISPKRSCAKAWELRLRRPLRTTDRLIWHRALYTGMTRRP